MGTYQSLLAGVIFNFVYTYVLRHRLGITLPPDGMMRLASGFVRIPDVSFVSFARLPGGRVPREAIADLAPDLAVEVISLSNTQREMQRKLTDYFTACVRLVWYVYPEPREVHVFTSPSDCVVLTEQQTLTGGDVLPGFEVALAEVLAEPGAPPN